MIFKRVFKNKYIFIILPLLALGFVIGYSLYSYYYSFDSSSFQADNVYKHIEELSSAAYKGRLPGTKGNERALKYIEDYFKAIGVEPGGDDGTYYQSFRTIIPQVDNDPHFVIEDEEGRVVESFTMYKDYRVYTFSHGGEIDFKGDVVFIDRYLYGVDPTIMKDAIVVTAASEFRDKDLDYVLDNGAKGLLFYQDPAWGQSDQKVYEMKSTSSGHKKGKTLLWGPISLETYKKFKMYARENRCEDSGITTSGVVIGKIDNVSMKVDIGFPILETSNILGKIEGKDKNAGYLIVSGHMDHVGEGTHGKFFPGALDNASGTGMVLELARIIKAQKTPPDKTIIFVGWNAEEDGILGSSYYVENPIYPLEQTQVLAIDCIGDKNTDKIILEASGDRGNILKSAIYQYGEDLGIRVQTVLGNTGSDHAPFLMQEVPAVMIADGYTNIHKYGDNIENIDVEKLDKVGRMLTHYMKHEVYGDIIPDYLTVYELLLISFMILGLFFIYMIYILNKMDSSIKIFGVTIEDIYYSTAFTILSKCFYYAIPIIAIVFSMIFIVNLPSDFNVAIDEVGVNTNFSLYLTVKKSILYLRQLSTEGLGKTGKSDDVLKIIIDTFTKSGILMVFTVIFSLLLGITKGCFDSYKGKRKGELRTISTLAALSLPDVLIVLLAMMMIIMVAKNEMLSQFISAKTLREFVMPLATLTILPSVYISRITFITIQEELKNGYVNTAKAKGLSKFRIYSKHILPSVMIKVVDSLSSVLTIIISNLIIVEFLFGYPGIIYHLLQCYKQDDTITFIGLALALGLMYVTFNLVFKLIARLINPLKREGVY
ncbi:MAG: M28 family peptidase [Bacillota bacterium]